MTDEAEIQRVVAAHRERWGRLDVLVNNAGIGVGAPVADHETKKVDIQLDLNLRAIILFYRECMDMLRAAGAEHKNALAGQPPRSPARRARRGCRFTRRRSSPSSAGRSR